MELILSDGTREYDFLADGDIYVQQEGIQLPVVSDENTYAEGSDSEGRTRIRSRATNSEAGSFSVYFKATNADDFWDAVDNLQELVLSAHRNKGTITYTPPGGVAVTYDLEAINVTDLPQKGVHLQQFHGEATVSFETKPYGRLDTQPLIESETLVGPIDSVDVGLVPGQAPAWGTLTLTDSDSVARNHVEVGVQYDYDPDNPEPLLLEAVTDLSALAGSSNTRAGSHSTNILRAALTTSAVAVCTSDEQPHKGSWKVRARVWPSATTVRVRLAWRAGDGPFAHEKWVSVQNEDAWFDMDLGTVPIKELPSGHTVEFRVEAMTTSGVPTVDVDYIELIPADNYTRLRGSSSLDTPSAAIVAVDDFSTQTSGAVSGKTPLLVPSGTWTGDGDTDDFQVDTTNQNIYRDAVSDSAANNGRYLRCGSGVLAATIVRADVLLSGGYPYFPEGRFGVFLRYTNPSNWLMAVYINYFQISLIKRVGGTETVLGTFSDFSGSIPFIGGRVIMAGADAAGNVIVYDGPASGSLVPRLLILGDSDLATSGTLDDGGYGIYDAETAGTSEGRYYDNFSASTLATTATIINPAINEDYGLTLTHETALTESATSTGTTPIREGQYLTLPPSTRSASRSRVVVRSRRNDPALGFGDEGIADSLDVGLSVTPRVHLTGSN